MERAARPRQPTTPLPARPVQERGRVTRERILSSALHEFRERGVQDTTLDDIKDRAGVGWGTLHHWFPRRQDLYTAAMIDRLDLASARATAWLGEPTGSVRPVLLGCYFDLLLPEGPPELYSLAMREAIEHPERLMAMLEPGQRPLFEIVLPLVEHAQETGELRSDVHAAVLARTLNTASLAPTGLAPASRSASAPSIPPTAAISVVLGVIWDGASATNTA